MQERNALENKNYMNDDNDVWLSNFPRKVRRKLANNEIYNVNHSEKEHRFSAINKIDSDKVVGSEYYKPYNYKYMRKRATSSNGQPIDPKNTMPISGRTPQDRFFDGSVLGRDLWALSEYESKNDIGSEFSSGRIKISTNKSFTKKPIFLDGLEYSVIIGDGNIYIGCQGKTIEEWKKASDKEIMKMDGKKSLSFWRKYKTSIIKFAETHCEEEK